LEAEHVVQAGSVGTRNNAIDCMGFQRELPLELQEECDLTEYQLWAQRGSQAKQA